MRTWIEASCRRSSSRNKKEWGHPIPRVDQREALGAFYQNNKLDWSGREELNLRPLHPKGAQGAWLETALTQGGNMS